MAPLRNKGSEWKLILLAWAYLCPFPPAKIFQNVFNCRFSSVWSTTWPFILSVRGHASKPVPNDLDLNTASTCLSALEPCMICPPMFLFSRQSLPLSISLVLPWMVFLKWRSPRSLAIQWHLAKDRWGCDPVTSPKTQTELPPPMKDGC